MSLARELGIKKGACARLTKELANYSEEAKTTAEKVASMRAAGEAPHDVKHAVSLEAESEREGLLGNRMIDGLANKGGKNEDDRSRVFRFLHLFSPSSPLSSPPPFPFTSGKHRRRVCPDGSGHATAPGRRRSRHAEAPGERERKSWFLSLFSFFGFSFSLEQLFSLFLSPSHDFSPQQKNLQDESDLSETPEDDVKAAREAAEAAEAALAKAAADGE